MKLFKSSVVMGLCSAFLLCGCASYRVKPLRKLTKETAQFACEKNNIQVCASRLEEHEFKNYTSGMCFAKHKKIVPVLITVYNNGTNDLVWLSQEVDLTLIFADEAVSYLGYNNGSLIHTGTGNFVGFVLRGYGLIAGFVLGGYGLIWLGAGFSSICGCSGWNLLTATGAFIFCAALPLTVSVLAYNTYYGHRAFNNMLLVDLRDKVLSRVDLAPCDGMSKLIIAKDDQLVEPFKMRIRQVGTNKITEFAVALPPLAADKK